MVHDEIDPFTSSDPSFREVWNTTPVLRLVLPIMFFSFLWSMIVPQSVPMWLLVPDLLVSLLSLGAIAVAGTKFALSFDGEDTPALLSGSSYFSIRIERQVWPLSSSSRAEKPSPPPGYDSPTRVTSGSSVLRKTFLVGTWFLVGLMAFTKALSYILPAALLSDFSFSWPLLIGTLGLIAVLFPATYALLGALLGYDITLGVLIPFGVYGRHSGKLRTRADRLILSTVPVALVAGLFMGGLMFSPSPLIRSLSGLGLFGTVISSGICFHNAVRALRAPPGQLWYSRQERAAPLFVYEPTDAGESSFRRIEKRLLKATDFLKVSEHPLNAITSD